MTLMGAKQPRPGSDSPIHAPGDTLPAMAATPPSIRVNRAPVLTLWATVVAERLGYSKTNAPTRSVKLSGTRQTVTSVRRAKPSARRRRRLALSLVRWRATVAHCVSAEQAIELQLDNTVALARTALQAAAVEDRGIH